MEKSFDLCMLFNEVTLNTYTYLKSMKESFKHNSEGHFFFALNFQEMSVPRHYEKRAGQTTLKTLLENSLEWLMISYGLFQTMFKMLPYSSPTVLT